MRWPPAPPCLPPPPSSRPLLTRLAFAEWHIERSLELGRFGWSDFEALGAQAHRAASEQGAKEEVALTPGLSRFHSGPAGYNDNLHCQSSLPSHAPLNLRQLTVACWADGVTEATPAERGMAGPTDCALEYLEARLAEGSEQPWCCVSSYYEPNEAMVVGREAYELYDVDSLPLPPNLRDPMTDKPNIYRREQQIFAGVSDDEWRAAKACYLGRITEIDAELGRLLALLREHDALESTIVIVSSLASIAPPRCHPERSEQ